MFGRVGAGREGVAFEVMVARCVLFVGVSNSALRGSRRASVTFEKPFMRADLGSLGCSWFSSSVSIRGRGHRYINQLVLSVLARRLRPFFWRPAGVQCCHQKRKDCAVSSAPPPSLAQAHSGSPSLSCQPHQTLTSLPSPRLPGFEQGTLHAPPHPTKQTTNPSFNCKTPFCMTSTFGCHLQRSATLPKLFSQVVPILHTPASVQRTCCMSSSSSGTMQ